MQWPAGRASVFPWRARVCPSLLASAAASRTAVHGGEWAVCRPDDAGFRERSRSALHTYIWPRYRSAGGCRTAAEGPGDERRGRGGGLGVVYTGRLEERCGEGGGGL
ncbi:hypothetical protein K491DRAFT_358483 [Lophiostoma macrostomum CBS 122681]|uniref:Uncharacterized protein n=1 Tax=Lophiostoma macrostomum CBS 122681 TaxID=1314788 RepID=A0A6A6TCW6_9PLEO|nr:hypothetical protein K491DRAFT_358483 [Lophiostoma macrostomum CBS 122681]